LSLNSNAYFSTSPDNSRAFVDSMLDKISLIFSRVHVGDEYLMAFSIKNFTENRGCPFDIRRVFDTKSLDKHQSEVKLSKEAELMLLPNCKSLQKIGFQSLTGSFKPFSLR
jgi:hypothetical protein